MKYTEILAGLKMHGLAAADFAWRLFGLRRNKQREDMMMVNSELRVSKTICQNEWGKPGSILYYTLGEYIQSNSVYSK